MVELQSAAVSRVVQDQQQLAEWDAIFEDEDGVDSGKEVRIVLNCLNPGVGCLT